MFVCLLFAAVFGWQHLAAAGVWLSSEMLSRFEGDRHASDPAPYRQGLELTFPPRGQGQFPVSWLFACILLRLCLLLGLVSQEENCLTFVAFCNINRREREDWPVQTIPCFGFRNFVHVNFSQYYWVIKTLSFQQKTVPAAGCWKAKGEPPDG